MKQINTHYLNFKSSNQFNHQKGAVLIIGLILLFSLTLLGIGAMSTNLMQQRMAANMGDAALAFNAADSIIRREQRWLRAQPLESALLKADCDNNTQCIYFAGEDIKNVLVTAYTEEWWEDPAVFNKAWWDANAYEYCCNPLPSDLANVKSDPRVVIERQQYELDTLDLGTTSHPTGVTYYRMTARGTGSTDLSEAVIQATVSKRWN